MHNLVFTLAAGVVGGTCATWTLGVGWLAVQVFLFRRREKRAKR